jgi:hypothetical protein
MSYSSVPTKKLPAKRDAMLDAILGKSTKSKPVMASALVVSDVYENYEFAVHDDFIHMVRREISALEAPDNTTRKRAAEKLENLLVQLSDQNRDLQAQATKAGQSCAACLPGVPSPETLIQIFGEIHKPMLKRLVDPIERVRDAAVRILIRMTNSLARPDSLLPFVIPILVFRYSALAKDQLEPSEEIRVQVNSYNEIVYTYFMGPFVSFFFFFHFFIQAFMLFYFIILIF